MSKTDKELAVEFASSFISSLNSSPHTQPIRSDAAIQILNSAYDALHSKKDE